MGNCCPICDVDGIESAVTCHDPIDETRQVYAARFVDKKGDFHMHPVSVNPCLAVCTRGHIWRTPVVYGCWCGWNNEVLS